jgi:hypothetical protein
MPTLSPRPFLVPSSPVSGLLAVLVDPDIGLIHEEGKKDGEEREGVEGGGHSI